MATKIAFANNKGGILKTTLSSNLASYLSKLNKKVLIVDTDTQNNISYAFNIQNKVNLNKTIYEVMFKELAIKEAIYSYNSNIDIITTNQNWLNFEYDILDPKIKNSFKQLSSVIEEIENEYDYIIFDTEPKKSASTFSVLLAADELIIPLELNKYSLIGVIELYEWVKIAQNKKPNLKIKSFIPVKTLHNSSYQKHIYKNIDKSLPIELVSKITIPISTQAEKSLINYDCPMFLKENKFWMFNVFKQMKLFFKSLNYE